MSKIFQYYERGIKNLQDSLAKDHITDAEFSTLQARMLENIEQARLYGDTENLRSERLRIIYSLNEYALQKIDTNFNLLCGLDNLSTDVRELLAIFDYKEYLNNLIDELIQKPELYQNFTPLHLSVIKHPVSLLNRIVEAEQDEESDLTLENILELKANTFILGDAGSGKTTILGWMALQIALLARTKLDVPSLLENVAIPILISLNRFNAIKGQTTFDKLLSLLHERLIYFGCLESNADKSVLVKLLKNFRFTLLFDGLNEVSSSEIDTIIIAIKELANLSPNQRSLITSRQFHKLQIVRHLNFPLTLKIQELSFDQAQIFIHKYQDYFDLDDLMYDSFDQRVRHLGQNPLYLRFILELIAEDRPLAKTPSGLIGGIMQKRLEWESLPSCSDESNLSDELSMQDYLEWKALSKLALYLNKVGGTAPLYGEENCVNSPLTIIVKTIQDPNRIETLIEKWSQKQIIHLSAGHLEFCHPTFQTYLIADSIASEVCKSTAVSADELDIQKLQKLIEDESLHDAIAMAVALVEPATAQKMIKEISQVSTILTGMCLNNIAEGEEMREQFIRDMYKTYQWLRIDPIGILLMSCIALFMFLVFSHILIPSGIANFIRNQLHIFSSVFSFLTFIIVLACVLEILRVLYSRWVIDGYISPMARAIGSIRFPIAIETLEKMWADAENLCIVEGLGYTVAQARIRSVESLTELDKTIEKGIMITTAVEELVHRQSSDALEILIKNYHSISNYKLKLMLMEGIIIYAKMGDYEQKTIPVIQQFYIKHHNVCNWALRIDIYRCLRNKVNRLAFPWPKFKELVLTESPSGFLYLDFIKLFLHYIFILVIFGGITWLIKWLIR